MYKRLSHTLNTRDHAFPGAPTLQIEPFESMQKGDELNTFNLRLFNHFGTHMDGPFHFNGKGKQLWQMELSTFIFERPLLIDVPKGSGGKIEPEDLLPFDEAIRRADGLFIRSGYAAVRASDNQAYSEKGPAVSLAAAQLIVDRYQNLKAVGMDWISLGSPLYPEEGVKAHQIMLGQTGADPVLIIEDIDLSGIDPQALEQMFVLPLFVEGIDSAPVTILAKLRDE